MWRWLRILEGFFISCIRISHFFYQILFQTNKSFLFVVTITGSPLFEDAFVTFIKYFFLSNSPYFIYYIYFPDPLKMGRIIGPCKLYYNYSYFTVCTGNLVSSNIVSSILLKLNKTSWTHCIKHNMNFLIYVGHGQNISP